MNIGDRVKYNECADCIPDRGNGTIIGIIKLGIVVRWDCGISNLCDINKLERV